MQTKHHCDLIHIWTKGEVVAPLNMFKPSVKKCFYRPFKGSASFVDHLYNFCLVLLCFHARLFVDAFRSPAWLSFVMSNCDVVTFPLVSWVRCGAWLNRILIFDLFITLSWTFTTVYHWNENKGLFEGDALLNLSNRLWKRKRFVKSSYFSSAG